MPPKPCATYSAGSSRQDGIYNLEPQPHVVQAILDEARVFLPSLADSLCPNNPELRVRTGVRPAAARRRPIISRVPGCEGAVMAAGHEGSGLTMALSTAELVAELVLADPDAQVPASAEPFQTGQRRPF